MVIGSVKFRGLVIELKKSDVIIRERFCPRAWGKIYVFLMVKSINVADMEAFHGF